MQRPSATLFKECLEAQFPRLRVAGLAGARTAGNVVGIVGIRSAGAYGSGGIAISEANAAQLVPRFDDEPVEICDWVGEMVNQVLGRVKLKLGKHALAMRATTPLVLETADMRFKSRGTVKVFRISDGETEFIAWFDMDLSGFDETVDAIADCMIPGESMLFE